MDTPYTHLHITSPSSPHYHHYHHHHIVVIITIITITIHRVVAQPTRWSPIVIWVFVGQTHISKKYSIVLCYTQGHHHHHRHHSIAIFGTYLCAAYTNNVSSFTGTVKRHIFSQRKVQLWGAMIHTYMYKLYSYYIHCENATLANLQRRRLEEYIIIIRWQNFCSRGLWTLGVFVFTTWVSLKILWTWNTSYDCNGLTICFHCGTTRAASYMQRSKVECMLHVSECITGH